MLRRERRPSISQRKSCSCTVRALFVHCSCTVRALFVHKEQFLRHRSLAVQENMLVHKELFPKHCPLRWENMLVHCSCTVRARLVHRQLFVAHRPFRRKKTCSCTARCTRNHFIHCTVLAARKHVRAQGTISRALPLAVGKHVRAQRVHKEQFCQAPALAAQENMLVHKELFHPRHCRERRRVRPGKPAKTR
jgi:hypothetical protein